MSAMQTAGKTDVSQDGEITKKVRCIMIGRLPRREGDQFKTAVFRFFDKNNGHKTGEFPIDTLEYPNIEKVRIRRMNVSYYLEGNDIIVNDLEEVRLIKKGSLIMVRGYQGGNVDLDV
ncbi:MAG: hypothetical protein KJ574_00290 [Nanoarchaeota archaeon]|nr:hypothetical protein [Nanoarchaeota archaeon]